MQTKPKNEFLTFDFVLFFSRESSKKALTTYYCLFSFFPFGNDLNQVINGILAVYVSVQRNKKPEVDSADRAYAVSTLTEGFVFTQCP